MITDVLHSGFYAQVPIGTIIIWAGKKVGLEKPSKEKEDAQLSIQESEKEEAQKAVPKLYNPSSDGWLVCDGSVLDCGKYYALWQVLGNVYNTSACKANQFQLPDFRGYFLRAIDTRDPESDKIDQDPRTPPSGDSKSLAGTTQESAFQTHKHDYTMPEEPSVIPGSEGSTKAVASVEKDQLTSPPKVNPLSKPGGKTQTNPVSSFETRPINISVYYLIKAN